MKKNNFKPWYVLVVCCGLAASSIGISINSSGVFYTPVSESLGVMRGTFAMHMTIFSLITAITALIVPKLMSRFSYKWILIISVAITVISTSMMANVKSVTMAYLLGGIRGFSTGLFSIVPLTMIINGWFKKNHGLATSIVFGFSGIAGAICSPILSRCIELFGWQTGYLIKSGIILLLCLPAIIYPFKVTANEEGLTPFVHKENEDDFKEINNNKVFNFMTVAFICFCTLSFINTTITGITQHLPGFAQSIGYGTTLGAMLLSASMIGNVISKLIIGVMSDRLGEVKASVTMMIANVSGIILIIVSKSSIGLLIGSFLFGSIYSVGAVGIPLLTKHFFGMDNYSKVFPIISFASNFGAAFALSLVGYIYDFTDSYSYAFILGIAINIICLALMFIVVKYNKINGLESKSHLKEYQAKEVLQ